MQSLALELPDRGPGAASCYVTGCSSGSLEPGTNVITLDDSCVDERGAGLLIGDFTDPHGAVAMLDVTPAPLRALQLAEFLQWYAVAATERSGPDLATLYRSRAMIEASRHGTPEAGFEASLWCDKADPYNTAHQFLWCDDPATAKRQHHVFEKYRVYAWRCAMGKVLKYRFLTSLPTSPNQVSGTDRQWRDVALDVAQKTKALLGEAKAARHPVFDPAIAPEDLMLGTVGHRAILAYYDLYVFGQDLDHDTDQQPLDDLLDPQTRAWERQPAKLSLTVQRVLEKAPYDAFVRALHQITCDDTTLGLLQQRYLEAAANAAFCWWLPLAKQGGKAAFWEELKPGMKLLARGLKATGKTLSGLVQERLDAYTLAFQEAHALLESLYRHEIAVSGVTVNPDEHYLARVSDTPDAPNYRALVNVKNGELTIMREHAVEADAQPKVTLQLLRRVEDADDALHHGPAQNAHAFEVAQKLNATFSKTLVVPVDLAELKRRHTMLPKGFSLCAETISLGASAMKIVHTLRGELKITDTLVATWEVVSGVVKVANSYQSVLKSMRPAIDASSFLKPAAGGAALTLAGGVYTGGMQIYQGGEILFSEEGDLTYELRHGRGLRAVTQGSKGVLQIAVGAVGVLGAIPATAALAATPVGLAIAVGGALIVATIDVVLDATHPYEEHIRAFEAELDKARRSELADGKLRIIESLDFALKRVEGAFVA